MSAKKFISATGAPVADNTNSLTAGPGGPILLQDIWLIEKLAHFDRKVIPDPAYGEGVAKAIGISTRELVSAK